MPMKTFLQSVAESLLNRFGNNLSQLVVVFPGKRAGLFLDQALAAATDAPLWSPSYTTISEFFERASAYSLCDPVESVCRLYRCYAAHVPSPQSLDQFYGWGQVLLSDFDDMDKHCVDVTQLFANIRDLHALDDNTFLTPEQIEALRGFFSKFDPAEDTELKRRFLELWEQMPAIYEELNATMRADGLLYEGALQREVVRQLASFQSDKTYVFVGFNVLNTVEQSLFDELQRRGQALFFWDYDKFYIENHEAGHFLRQNLQRYGNELPIDRFDNLRRPKQITFISASSENIQARYVPRWLGENLTQPENESAVVLCNEQLLQPILHAIPDPTMPVNITMGFPLTDTPVYNFLLSLAALQTDGWDAAARRFRRSQLTTVTAHPYSRLLADESWRRKCEGGRGLLLYLQDILTLLGQQIHDDIIAQEAVFIAYTRLNRLLDLMNGEAPLLAVTDATLLRVLRQVLQSETIPFHGEPATGLQVMGVLETRALDFRHLLMLSVGEGFLPKQVADNSFIPYFLREAFGLTTVRHKIAVYAYYFYRLIQRAERLTFVYNESNAGVRQNEISRFLRQLLAETDFPVTMLRLRADNAVQPAVSLVREKTPEVMNRLRLLFNNRGLRGHERHLLSPTALNNYTACPMKFYYRYVEGLRIDPNPQDGLDASLFGDVFHRAAELLYRQLTSAGDVVRGQDLDPFLAKDGVMLLTPFVHQAFRDKFFEDSPEDYRGILVIAERVIHTYLLQLLRHDRQLTPFRVLALEKPVRKTLVVGDWELDLGGYIDRMDLVPDDLVEGAKAIRVVDYKTGGRLGAVSSLDRLFSDTDQTAQYYFQSILYASIVAEREKMPVTPCLFFVHRAGSPDYTPKLRLAGQMLHDVRTILPSADAAHHDAASPTFTDGLESLIATIFNPAIPFTQTDSASTCLHCPYAGLCQR